MEMSDEMPTRAVADYLQAIFAIASEGRAVIGARVAEWLGVTPPTVVGMIHRLARDGLVEMNERKEISLTPKGEGLAAVMLRRHMLAERLLAEVIGLEWHKVHHEAHSFEHAISAEVEQKLTALLGEPTTCPHGNPIPGTAGAYAPPGVLSPLSEVREGERVVIDRISEEAELDQRALEYMERNRLMPGQELVVQEVAPYAGTISVWNGDEKVTVGLRIAAKIRVRAASLPAGHRQSS
ncbi:MAG: metal-dependent transcriptional regulator [Chloroflexota bacterium]|nr:metal-dependent transcriptional regulator [Chloroflexota bacterium]